MTVLTKPINEKKIGKLALPLVTNEIPSHNDAVIRDNESDDLHIIHARRRMSSSTFFLFLAAITVMCMGILGGVAIYRLYAPSQLEKMRFHGFCGVPYDSRSISNADMLQANINWKDDVQSESSAKTNEFFKPISHRLQKNLDNEFFREEFDLDWSDEQAFAKITVPDFKDGRRGRFIHDFKENQSAIIDNSAGRCFIMPLDRDTVLPPKTIYDLLNKMWNGYYNIDTDRLRRNMRIVTPELKDLSLVSPIIASECTDMRVYLLEKYVSGVFKRNAFLTDSGKFAEFSGNHIVEIDLVNIAEIDEMEKKLQKN